MKFTYKVFYIVIFFNILFIRAQNNKAVIEVIYNQAIVPKDNNLATPKVLKGVSYKLLCSSYQSIFKLENNLDNDIYKRNGLYVAKAGGNSVFFRDLLSNEKYRTIRGFEENNVLVIQDINEYKIQLTQENKKIGKYLCFKAIFTKKSKYGKIKRITAWYTPAIPNPFGPVGFEGLPGLIIELYYKGNVFKAEKISLLNNEKLINKPVGNIYTLDEMKEMFRLKTGVDFDKKMKQKYKKRRK